MFYGNSYFGQDDLPDESSTGESAPVSPEVEAQVEAEEEIKAAIDGYLKSISPEAVQALYGALAMVVSSNASKEEKDEAYLLYLTLRTVQAYRKELSLTRVLGEQEQPHSDYTVADSEAEALKLGKKLGIEMEVDQVLNDFSSAEEVISLVPIYPVGDELKEIESPSPGNDLRAINQAQAILSVQNGTLNNYKIKKDIPTWIYFAVGGAVLFGLTSLSKGR